MFTRKASLYFALATTVLILGLLLGDLQLASFTLPIATLFFFSNFWGIPETVEFTMSHDLYPTDSFGEEDVTVKVRISNKTGGLIGNVEISENLPIGVSLKSGASEIFSQLAPLESLELDLVFDSPIRGHYDVGPLVVRIQDPFGFYLVEKRMDPILLSIMPRPEKIRGATIRPRHLGPWPGTIPSRTLGQGTEFYSLRNYAAGDDPKRINWKASAKNARLVVNEMEAEKVTDVMIVLDTDVTFYEAAEAELFERGVRATASMASLLLRQGNRVGLILQGEERGIVPPAFGKRHERNILFLLAAAKPGRSLIPTGYVITVLARLLLPAKSQIVIVSPLLDTAIVEGVRKLATIGYSILVLSTPPEAPSKFESEMEEIAFRVLMLQRSNTLIALEKICAIAEWPQGIPLSTVLRGVRPLAQLARISA